jgi:hypothetical protein
MEQKLPGEPLTKWYQKLDWNCKCVVCAFDHIWVVMTDRIIVQPDGTVHGDEDPEVVQNGYPLFWIRGRRGPDWIGEGLSDWAHAVNEAKHYVNQRDADDARAEALILHPSLIGRANSVQFRIR